MFSYACEGLSAALQLICGGICFGSFVKKDGHPFETLRALQHHYGCSVVASGSTKCSAMNMFADSKSDGRMSSNTH